MHCVRAWHQMLQYTVSGLGIKWCNALCQGLTSNAALHCVRAWHQMLQYTVSGLDIKWCNAPCQGLTSNAAVHRVRAWHQVLHFIVSGLGILVHMQSTRTRQINLWNAITIMMIRTMKIIMRINREQGKKMNSKGERIIPRFKKGSYKQATRSWPATDRQSDHCRLYPKI